MKKRALAILLCLTLLLGLLPVGAVAVGTEPESGTHIAHEGWTAWGDVYTLSKGDLALHQADFVTLAEEETPVEETPEAPAETPDNAKQTVLIVFGSLLAVAAVLSVIAILAVKKMKNNAEK